MGSKCDEGDANDATVTIATDSRAFGSGETRRQTCEKRCPVPSHEEDDDSVDEIDIYEHTGTMRRHAHTHASTCISVCR